MTISFFSMFTTETSFYKGTDCIRNVAYQCGAKHPRNLTSKETRCNSKVLNLTNTEMDQLADFLGHDIRAHRKFYQLPEGTFQLAKISKVLMALVQERVSEFKGKNLDEINLEPNGKDTWHSNCCSYTFLQLFRAVTRKSFLQLHMVLGNKCFSKYCGENAYR